MRLLGLKIIPIILFVLIVPLLVFSLTTALFAQEDGGNSNSSSGNESNQNNSQDNTPNTCDHVMNSSSDCGGGSGPPSITNPDWDGHVRNTTGQTLTGAQITIQCSGGSGGATTNSVGYYYSSPIPGVNSLCNPITVSATYNGQNCQQKVLNISSTIARVTTDFVCNVPPACGAACTTPANCQGAENGCTSCLPNATGGGSSCQKPPSCGAACTTPASCFGAENGCTACLPNANGSGNTCQTPPRCGSTCTTSTSCSTSEDSCTSCLPDPNNPNQNTCQPKPACGSGCVNPASCVGALGCTACLPNLNNPSQSTCQPTPACGSGCVSPASCVGAENGCTACIKEASGSATIARCGKCPVGMNYDPTQQKCVCPNPGETNPHGVCDGDKCTQVGSCGITECTTDKQCFAEEMCKCDGFEATQLEYPSNKPFSFAAFAKVEGTDIRRAVVEGIQFKISESDKSNPNAGTIIAQSPMYTPEIVSSSSAKLRYKATWNLTPPQIKPNKVYRVFSEIKCAPKKKRSTTANVSDPNQYQSKVAGISSAQAQELYDGADIEVAGDDIQLKTLNFVKKGQTDKCRFLFFEYNQGL